jgi:hypothetical protein
MDDRRAVSDEPAVPLDPEGGRLTYAAEDEVVVPDGVRSDKDYLVPFLGAQRH